MSQLWKRFGCRVTMPPECPISLWIPRLGLMLYIDLRPASEMAPDGSFEFFAENQQDQDVGADVDQQQFAEIIGCGVRRLTVSERLEANQLPEGPEGHGESEEAERN